MRRAVQQVPIFWEEISGSKYLESILWESLKTRIPAIYFLKIYHVPIQQLLEKPDELWSPAEAPSRHIQCEKKNDFNTPGITTVKHLQKKIDSERASTKLGYIARCRLNTSSANRNNLIPTIQGRKDGQEGDEIIKTLEDIDKKLTDMLAFMRELQQ